MVAPSPASLSTTLVLYPACVFQADLLVRDLFLCQDEDEEEEDSDDDEDWGPSDSESDSESDEDEGKYTSLASKFLKK